MSPTIHPPLLTETKDDCPFCNYGGPSPVLWERGGCFVIEPLGPVTEGHVLVIPRGHVESFVVDPWLAANVMETAAMWANGRQFVTSWGEGGRRARMDVLEWPTDWNVITSAGELATQTVMHLHLHVIPRREGDGLLLPWSLSGGGDGLHG
jgi:histidine triad (HIT) family protein